MTTQTGKGKKKTAEKDKTFDKAPDKQIQFAQEYIIDFNGKQAAIRAGYSERSAEVTASRMLRTAKVRSEIERLLEDHVGKRNETRERILTELEEMAYTDDAIEVRRDREGEILEVSRRDKLRAIELLGKMHGLFTDRQEVQLSGVGGSPVKFEIVDANTTSD